MGMAPPPVGSVGLLRAPAGVVRYALAHGYRARREHHVQGLIDDRGNGPGSGCALDDLMAHNLALFVSGCLTLSSALVWEYVW